MPFAAEDVSLSDIAVFDVANGRALGFYLHAMRNGATGLEIEFAFQRPSGREIRLEVSEIYLARRSVSSGLDQYTTEFSILDPR